MSEEVTSGGKSVISQDVEITGQVRSSGSIEVNGKLDGELSAQGDAIVGKTAVVKGNLTVNSISVAGTVTGNITAKDRIELKSSAKVMGDIKAKRLAVEDGVTFVGKSEVNPSGGPAPAAAPAPSSDEGSSSADDKQSRFKK